jgi:hypothetical protein
MTKLQNSILFKVFSVGIFSSTVALLSSACNISNQRQIEQTAALTDSAESLDDHIPEGEAPPPPKSADTHPAVPAPSEGETSTTIDSQVLPQIAEEVEIDFVVPDPEPVPVPVPVPFNTPTPVPTPTPSPSVQPPLDARAELQRYFSRRLSPTLFLRLADSQATVEEFLTYKKELNLLYRRYLETNPSEGHALKVLTLIGIALQSQLAIQNQNPNQLHLSMRVLMEPLIGQMLVKFSNSKNAISSLMLVDFERSKILVTDENLRL